MLLTAPRARIIRLAWIDPQNLVRSANAVYPVSQFLHERRFVETGKDIQAQGVSEFRMSSSDGAGNATSMPEQSMRGYCFYNNSLDNQWLLLIPGYLVKLPGLLGDFPSGIRRCNIYEKLAEAGRRSPESRTQGEPQG
jgi:hypothetical protein